MPKFLLVVNDDTTSALRTKSSQGNLDVAASVAALLHDQFDEGKVGAPSIWLRKSLICHREEFDIQTKKKQLNA